MRLSAGRSALPSRVLAALACALLPVLVSAAPAAADHPRGTATFPEGLKLGPGEAVFWEGETAGTGDGPFEYSLSIGKGKRFRVAIDTPSRQDTFELSAVSPAGEVTSVENSNQFNEEVFVERPVPGLWQISVVPKNASDAFFRLRAKLEDRVRTPRPNRRGELLPNLRVVPPTEFGFIAPANPLNGVYPPDTVNPPLDVAGVHPLSCTVDEMLPPDLGGYGARKCLRLTSGPINVGRGPYDMRFTFTEDVLEGEGDLGLEEGTIQRAPMFQAIHRADGSLKLREAGTYSFHLTHAHFHDNNVLTYELFGVEPKAGGKGRKPSKPRLRKLSAGTKSGFCPADQLFGQWGRFNQDPSGYFGEGDSAGGSCFDPVDGFLGLSRGWGDVYRWQRPGQYVEFSGQGDGVYVVRTTVDKPGEVKETNEKDNTGYALIRVVGEDVRILERGQGRSPWDPRARTFSGAGPASRF